MIINRRPSSGFTLIELLVALGVTTVIITMLVTITASAMDGFRASRNTVSSAREAKAALDNFTNDLESFVVRSGNDFEWLWAESEQTLPGPNGNESPNASRLVFFTTATDRYDGAIGTTDDLGGDVSAVGYRLLYRDPVSDSEDEEFATFVLYRQLINPNEAFDSLLGTESLEEAYGEFENNESNSRNFVCENIYQFSLAFTVEFTESETLERRRIFVINAGNQDAVEQLSITGNGLSLDGQDPSGDNPISQGRIVSADISITVLNDSALDILRSASLQEEARRTLIEKNSTSFAKTILLPQP